MASDTGFAVNTCSRFVQLMQTKWRYTRVLKSSLSVEGSGIAGKPRRNGSEAEFRAEVRPQDAGSCSPPASSDRNDSVVRIGRTGKLVGSGSRLLRVTIRVASGQDHRGARAGSNSDGVPREPGTGSGRSRADRSRVDPECRSPSGRAPAGSSTPRKRRAVDRCSKGGEHRGRNTPTPSFQLETEPSRGRGSRTSGAKCCRSNLLASL